MASIDYDLLAAAMVRAQQQQLSNKTVGQLKTKLLDGAVETCDSLGTQEEKNDGSAGIVKEKRAGASGAKKGGVVVPKEQESESWSDEVERMIDEASSGSESSSFSGGPPGVASDVVRRTVTFGGVAQNGGGNHSVSGATGFYKQFVRGSQAEVLYKRLRYLGVLLPKGARAELAYCAFSAGTMPVVAVDGKIRLRGLACIGDAAISLHLANEMYHNDCPAESIQNARSKYTNDSHFIGVMQRLGLLSCVSFPPGVDPLTAKVGATAFEAIVGVMTVHMPPNDVALFLRTHNVFSGAIVRKG